MEAQPTDTATGPETRREILEWAEWFEAQASPEDRAWMYRQIMRVRNGLAIERD